MPDATADWLLTTADRGNPASTIDAGRLRVNGDADDQARRVDLHQWPVQRRHKLTLVLNGMEGHAADLDLAGVQRLHPHRPQLSRPPMTRPAKG